MPRKPNIVAQEHQGSTAPPLPPDEVLQAVAAVLRPAIRLLLRSGIDYPRLAAELKPLFIEQAVAEIEAAGHPTTDSAISLLSGVHRKDVRNWRLPGRLPGAHRPVGLSARVFARWIADADYTAAGQPRPLPRTGAAPSFESLVRAVTHDVHPFTVLQELIRLGIASVEIDDGGEIVVPAHTDFVPPAGSREALELLAANLSDHATAAAGARNPRPAASAGQQQQREHQGQQAMRELHGSLSLEVSSGPGCAGSQGPAQK
jgi:hypothetical protein